jgi:hypothetical protein
MTDRNQLDITDLVYFPATFLLAYLLSRWLPDVLASAVAVMLILAVGYLFSVARGRNGKSFLLPVLAAGVVTFVLRVLGWPD